MLTDFLRNETGQTASEYMLLISVVVIAIVGSALVFIPGWESGIKETACDVSRILRKGMSVGQCGDGQ